MLSSSKAIFLLATASAVAAGLLFWWWTGLIASTLGQCIGGAPPVGVDCRYDAHMYAALGFAAVSVMLLVAAIVRGITSARAHRHVP